VIENDTQQEPDSGSVHNELLESTAQTVSDIGNNVEPANEATPIVEASENSCSVVNDESVDKVATTDSNSVEESLESLVITADHEELDPGPDFNQIIKERHDKTLHTMEVSLKSKQSQ